MGKKKAAPAPTPKETPEQAKARVNEASTAFRALLEQYHVTLVVSSLNIQTGKILPQIDLVAKPLPT